MLTLTFTLMQWSAIANALRVAAAVYEDDATRLGGTLNARLSEQFTRQATEARTHATRIEQEVGC